jgi:hypothetical protein
MAAVAQSFTPASEDEIQIISVGQGCPHPVTYESCKTCHTCQACLNDKMDENKDVAYFCFNPKCRKVVCRACQTDALLVFMGKPPQGPIVACNRACLYKYRISITKPKEQQYRGRRGRPAKTGSSRNREQMSQTQQSSHRFSIARYFSKRT